MATMEDQDTVNIDLADIMDVVTLYKCKFCNFSCNEPTGIGQHVQQAHTLVKRNKPNSTDQVLQMISMPTNSGDHAHAVIMKEPVTLQFEASTQVDNTQEQSMEETESVNTSIAEVGILDGAVMEGTQIDLDAADRIIDSASLDHEDTAMDVDEGVNPEGISINKEIYLCGQCNLGFDSMENCKNHMINDHGIAIDEVDESEPSSQYEVLDAERSASPEVHVPGEIILPPNKVSVGTQVMTRKKPGRKRKVKPEAIPPKSVEEEFEEEMATVDDDEDGDSWVLPEKEPDPDPAEGGNGVGRRRRRLPTRLASLYYMGKRSPLRPPVVRHPPPIRIKTEPYKLRCPKMGCNIKFRTTPSLDLHLACHQRIETETGRREMFVCPKCDRSEAQWKVLRVHLWKEHTVDTDLYACEKCDFKVDTLFRLERHVQIHSEERPYVCPTCGKGFKQASQLHNHKAVHVGRTADPTKWYSNKLCDICKRTFANQKSLKIHIESVHCKERRFMCPYCNHATSRKAILDLHVRTHTGEKPFKCDMCAYMTGDHNSLRRHKMRHTGEKPYRCRYCPYSAIQAISLKTHMKNKHPGFEGIYACNLCQYQTVNESYYKQHLLDHENGLVQSIRTNVSARTDGGVGAQEGVVVAPTRPPPALLKAGVHPPQSVLHLAPMQRLITLPDGRHAVAIQPPMLTQPPPPPITNTQQAPLSIIKTADNGVLEVGSDMANLIYSALNALSQTGAVPDSAIANTQLANGSMAQPTVQSTTHEGVTTHTITFHIPPGEEGDENGNNRMGTIHGGDEVTINSGMTKVVQVEQDDGQVLLTIQPDQRQEQITVDVDGEEGDAPTEIRYITEDMATNVLQVQGDNSDIRVLEIVSPEKIVTIHDSDTDEQLNSSPVIIANGVGAEQEETNTIVMEVVDHEGNIQQTQYVTCTVDPPT